MSDLLQELAGQRVTIWTSHGVSRTGSLQDVRARWVGLVDQNGSTWLMPSDNIRLIKIICGGMTARATVGGLNPALIGRDVSVSTKTSEGSFTDTGELEAFDEDWLRVRKKSDQLYFPISSLVEMRLIPG